MYGVVGKCRKHNLAVDCTLDMFDKIVKLEMLYGCEVWGYNQSILIEKLHLKFCKHILNVKPSILILWFMHMVNKVGFLFQLTLRLE